MGKNEATSPTAPARRASRSPRRRDHPQPPPTPPSTSPRLSSPRSAAFACRVMLDSACHIGRMPAAQAASLSRGQPRRRRSLPRPPTLGPDDSRRRAGGETRRPLSPSESLGRADCKTRPFGLRIWPLAGNEPESHLAEPVAGWKGECGYFHDSTNPLGGGGHLSSVDEKSSIL